MRLLPVGFLVAIATVSSVVGGVYVIAASTANSMAGTFNRTESEQRASRAESQTAMKRASSRYAAARENCDRYKYAKKELCQSAARREERRIARRDATTEEGTP